MLLRRALLLLLILWVLALSLATQVHAATHGLGQHSNDCAGCQQHDNLSAALPLSSFMPAPPLATPQLPQGCASILFLCSAFSYAIRAPPLT